jgi:hypothetical protein
MLRALAFDRTRENNHPDGKPREKRGLGYNISSRRAQDRCRLISPTSVATPARCAANCKHPRTTHTESIKFCMDLQKVGPGIARKSGKTAQWRLCCHSGPDSPENYDKLQGARDPVLRRYRVEERGSIGRNLDGQTLVRLHVKYSHDGCFGVKLRVS